MFIGEDVKSLALVQGAPSITTVCNETVLQSNEGLGTFENIFHSRNILDPFTESVTVT
jgi:hypothetical protein